MKNFTSITLSILFAFLLTTAFTVFAQNQDDSDCGTIVTPENLEYINSIQQQLEYYENEYFDLITNRSSTALSSVPIKAHVIRTSAGTGGLSEAELNDAIANVNSYYANAFMEFYLCDGINYINDDDLYDYETNEEAAMTSANNVAGLINIYFTESVTSSSSGSGLCGYAYLPGGQDVILMANNCTTNGSTLPHEIGHFFSLLHTHGPSNSTQTDELVDGSNCATAGDRICDTPADPQLGYGNVNAACVYTGTATDDNGELFVPDPTNILSYSRKECRTYFSPQQYARMYASYQSARNYFNCPSLNANFTSDYTRDCSDNLLVTFTDTSVGATSWEWDVDGDDIIDYTIQNPTHNYSPGTYDVALTVSNGTETVTRVLANHIPFETEAVNTTQIHLDLFTDNWCEETSWEFKDASGTTLYSGGPYTQNVDDNTLFEYTFDVTLDECYTFEIFDSYGDGICCSQGNGYYELRADDDSLISSGGDFGFGKKDYIANETLSLDDYFANNNIGLYPNPASLNINIRINNGQLPEKLEIYNVLGQTTTLKSINTLQDLTVDVSSHSEGMYFIKVIKDGRSTTLPFVKQ